MAFLCRDNSTPARANARACADRKPKLGRSGDGVRQGRRVTVIYVAGPLNQARETLPVNDTPKFNIHFHTKALNESPTFRVM